MNREEVEAASTAWRNGRGFEPLVVEAAEEGRPDGGLAQRLRWYKDADDASARAQLTERLASSVARWLADRPAFLDGVDVVTCPGSMARSAPEAIVDMVPRLAIRHQRLLQAVRPVGRTHDPSAFAVARHASSLRVVVFDDAYVSGATSLSAADALTAAGAEVVAVLVSGRLSWASVEEAGGSGLGEGS